jgi:hypothetical protein
VFADESIVHDPGRWGVLPSPPDDHMALRWLPRRLMLAHYGNTRQNGAVDAPPTSVGGVSHFW